MGAPTRRRALTRVLCTSTVALVALLATTSMHRTPAAPELDHASHMITIPAAAYQAEAPVLPRTGWTATASDYESVHEDGSPQNVLDGDTATIWHSQYSTQTVPLPHSITIDMHVVQQVSALHYLPRQDGTSNGNGTIGQFEVALSTDATTWTTVASGTWADDASEKSAAFATSSARYVRLTALTEAGNRGPWSSAAEITMLGAPDVDPPATLLIPRRNFTATASDQETSAESDIAANVLDNDPATVWRSKFSGTPTALPHWITIDMGRAQLVSGLTYLPPPGGGNGTIGDYQVSTSVNGTTWSAPVASGTWADDASLKLASFTQTAVRYVRLTALSEAGNRGPYSAAGEINLVRPLDPSQAGQWSNVINFPLVPTSSVLLPHDKLLTFSAYAPNAFTEATSSPHYTQVSIMDLDTGVVSERQIANTNHQMFCPGLALLADGRLLVSGGADAATTSIYDPATDTWSSGPNMNIPRGYQSDVTLSDGRVFTIGGSWSGGIGGKDAEIYTPGGTWQRLPGITAQSILTDDPGGTYRADNHAWLFATAGGNVFQAGPARRMHWFTTSGDGTVRSAGFRGDSRDAMTGDAVLYDIGKIFTAGGSIAYNGEDATARAYTIDISGGPTVKPVVQRLPNMSFARSFATSVVLPNGQVVVAGGQQHAVPFTDGTADLQPELWTPATGAFTKLASMAVPRTYHSSGLLLQDGRVFVGGGGLCGTCLTNHPDGQILTPPYLLRADGSLRTRPVITSAPATTRHGATITVQATRGVTFSMVRVGAATHTVNTDQRRVPLTDVSAHAGTYTITLPDDRGTMVPGSWLLFALNGQGVPSIAKWVTVR